MRPATAASRALRLALVSCVALALLHAGCSDQRIAVGALLPALRPLPLLPGTQAQLSPLGLDCSAARPPTAGQRCAWRQGDADCRINFDTGGFLGTLGCATGALAYGCTAAAQGYICTWSDDDPACGVAVSSDRRTLGHLCGAALAAFGRSSQPPPSGGGGSTSASASAAGSGSAPDQMTVVGDGTLLVHTSVLPEVLQIQVSGPSSPPGAVALRVVIHSGASATVETRIDANLSDTVFTRAAGGLLSIQQTQPFTSTLMPTITVTLPMLQTIELDGGADVAVSGFSGLGTATVIQNGTGALTFSSTVALLQARNTASGPLTLAGSAMSLQALVEASGPLLARDLVATDGMIISDGSGDATATFAGGQVTLSTSGSGSIDWWGTGSSVNANANGSGGITHH